MADPTLSIQVDDPTAASGLGYLIIGTGTIGTGLIAPDNIYVEQSTNARSLSIRRGMSQFVDMLFRPDVGTLNVTFDNLTRGFDASANPVIVPGRGIKVQATYNATTYDLFTGKVDAWQPSYPAYKADAVTEAAANDGIAQLSPLNVGEQADAELTGRRIERLADLGGWPNTERALDDGLTMMPAGHETVSAWSAMLEAAMSEMGELYVEADGTLTFRDRATIVSESRSMTSQATFGDQGSELAFHDIQPVPSAAAQIRNSITIVYNQQGDSVTSSDPASIATYGLRDESLQMKIADQATALSIASFLVSQFKTPIYRFGSLTIRPSHSPTTLWPQVFGRKLGDRITVKLTPPGGGSRIIHDCFIRGIEHSVAASTSIRDWTTVFTLQDASLWPIPLIIGTGLIGGSDNSTIWF